MKTTFAVVLALFTSTFTLNAQCGRCGSDGGTIYVDENGKKVARTDIFRSVRQSNLLPDATGAVTVTLRSHLIGQAKSKNSLDAITEVILDYSLAAPLTLTGLDLRVRGTDNTEGTLALGPTVANPLIIRPGQGTLSFQGPNKAISSLINSSTGTSYTVVARTPSSPNGFSLGALLPTEEVVRLAALPVSADFAGGALAVSASIVRDASRAITSAEIRYDLRLIANRTTTPLFTSLEFRGGSENSGVLLRPAAPPTALPAGGQASIRFRQAIDVGDSAALAALEAIANDPNFLTVLVRSGTGGVNTTTTRLATARNASFFVQGDPVAGLPPSSFRAFGLTNFWLLSNSQGEPLAAFSRLDWTCTGFEPGSVFNTLTLAGSPAVSFPLDPTLNSLTTNSVGSASIYQSALLLGSDPLLKSLLLPSSFSTVLATTFNPNGALAVKWSQDFVSLSPIGPTIVGVQPSVTTPGSVLSIFGLSLPDQPVVSIGGKSASVLYSSPTQVNILVPKDAPIKSVDPPIDSFVYVVGRYEVSNGLKVDIDGAQPYIFTDENGPLVFFKDKGTRVTPDQPATSGDTIRIYVTGTPENANGWSYKSTLVTSDYEFVPVPVAEVPGIWLMEYRIGRDVPSGLQPLTVAATYAVGTSSFVFPSNTVRIPIK